MEAVWGLWNKLTANVNKQAFRNKIPLRKGYPKPLNFEFFLKLFVCLVIDAIGYLSYAFPIFGELGDVVWAPIAAMLIYALFGNALIAAGGFLEEILPGTDFIPTATIAFVLEYLGWAPELDTKKIK